MNLHGQEIEVTDRLLKVNGKKKIAEVWSLTINKPIDDTTVAIRDKIIDKAIAQGVMLEVITRGATEIIEPKLWKKESKLIYRYFKDPKNPMKMYERKVRN